MFWFPATFWVVKEEKPRIAGFLYLDKESSKVYNKFVKWLKLEVSYW
jgi:hypothetical protein